MRVDEVCSVAGSIFKELRIKKGYSLEQFAKIVGKTKEELENIEQGIPCRLTIFEMKRMVNSLGLNMFEFVALVDEKIN